MTALKRNQLIALRNARLGTSLTLKELTRVREKLKELVRQMPTPATRLYENEQQIGHFSAPLMSAMDYAHGPDKTVYGTYTVHRTQCQMMPWPSAQLVSLCRPGR